MNWYKKAEIEEYTVTPEEFWTMSYADKIRLASNNSISPQIQMLFFTINYNYKSYNNMGDILQTLAQNTGISSQTQSMFFTEKYCDVSYALQYLARNTSITPQTQLLFFTQEYKSKGNALWALATNPSITPQTQRLFLTEEYKEKTWLSEPNTLASSFKRGLERLFNREQLLGISKLNPSGIRQLLILKKRLAQVRKFW